LVQAAARKRSFPKLVTIGEIERGIQQASNPEFAHALASWLDSLTAIHGERILPFDLTVARRWGQLSARIGSNRPDLMIAATALEHGLTVATRNISDFESTGLAAIDPFGGPNRSARK
jgi:toxin FitB